MTAKKAIKRARRALKRADDALKKAAAALDQTAGVALPYNVATADTAKLHTEEVPDISARVVKLPASMPANNGLADAAQLLREKGPSAFKIGDEIEVFHELGKTHWVVIGIDHDEAPARKHTLTVMNTTILTGRCFDEPSLENPYGRNCWHLSSVRKWLNTDFLSGFSEKDRQAIVMTAKDTYSFSDAEYVRTRENVFLLSASEAGFEANGSSIRNEGKAYPYFKIGEEARQLCDKDGEKRHWWLRSPHLSSSHNVRNVTIAGGLSSNNADSGYGLAAACVIG